MTDSEFICPKGREVSDLLAYVEGDLDASTREGLEEHLKLCRACSEEVASLRRTALLLRNHPESLHPGEVELHRFVSSGEDPAGSIAAHIAWCEDCKEDVRILEEMLSVSQESPAQRHPMPQALIDELKEIYPPGERADLLQPLSAFLRGLLSQSFRLPVLAMGTAAAVLIIVVVSIPMWRTYKDSAVPLLTGPAREAVHPEGMPAPREAGKRFSTDEPDRRHASVAGRPEPHIHRQESPTDESSRPRASMKDKEREHTAAPGVLRKPSSVKEETFGMEIPPPKAPAEIVPSPEETRSTVDKVSAGPQSESKTSRKSTRRRAHVVSRGEARPQKFSVQELIPETHEVGRLKARKIPAPGPGARQSRIDTTTVPRGGTAKGPVRVRIIDRDGRAVPWLRFEPPEDFEYEGFDDAVEPRQEAGAVLRSVPNETKPQTLKEKDAEGLLVLIRVDTSKSLYDVRAELYEPGSDQAIKTIEAFGISRGEMEKRIKSIVSSLLKKR